MMKEITIPAEIYNYRAWIEGTDSAQLRTDLDQLIRRCGYSVLNFVEHHFPVKGYTCLWLLGESHLAIHTFPETNESYVELSGCNEIMNDTFQREFESTFVKTRN